MQIPIPETKPFFGLMGPDPGSALVSQENPYTTGPFGISPRSTDQSLTRSNMGGCKNQVSAPLDGCDVDFIT